LKDPGDEMQFKLVSLGFILYSRSEAEGEIVGKGDRREAADRDLGPRDVSGTASQEKEKGFPGKALLIFKRSIGKEPFLSLLLFLLFLFSLINPGGVLLYPSYVDWRTLAALAGLLMVTSGLKESGYFDRITVKMLEGLKSERKIALFLIMISAGLSTFLTNDIALFVVVPLTLSMGDRFEGDVTKLIVFEALAVNVGSTLTPIGNPQNLFLWHLWGISFLEFIVRMLPVTVLVFGVLVLFARWAFPEDRVAVKVIEKDVYGNRGIFILSLVLMLLYVVALELRWTEFALPFLFIVYFITSRRVLLRADWLLILLFAAVFIDFHILSELPLVDRVVSSLSSGLPSRVFLLSAALSQLVSNVPAAVLMSKLTDKWQALAYGVNVGGNGLVIASLANLIALRLGGRRGAFGLFHRYSIPFFLITLSASYILFFLL